MNVLRSLSAGLVLTVSVTAVSTIVFAADPIKIGVPVGLSGANSVVAPSVVQSAQLAVDEINAKGGVLGRQLALEVADDASGAAGAQKAFDSLISQKKVDVLISMDGSDWTPIVSKLKSAAPDALITSTAGGAPNVTLTKQLRAAGVKMPYGNLAVDEGTAKSMGTEAEGIYLSASYVTGIESAANKTFLAAMAKKFGADLKTPNDLSVPEYEAVYAYKAAVEKAGSTESGAVLKALGEVSVQGPRGTIVMSKQHHAPLSMYLGQVQGDGSVKVIQSFPSVDPGEQ